MLKDTASFNSTHLFCCTISQAFLLLFCFHSLPAADRLKTPEHQKQFVEVSTIFLSALSEDNKAKATLPYGSAERLRWSNLPDYYERKGLSVADMSSTEKKALHQFLSAVLSPSGYLKLTNIMRQDNLISGMHRANGNALANSYGAKVYKIAFFGAPSTSEPWAFRFEGHHLSLNYHFTDGQILTTPMFIGANPATTLEGDMAGASHMRQEEHYSWQLLHSLSSAQLQQALYSGKMPDDIQVRRGDEPWLNQEEGIKFEALSEAQRGLLHQVVRAWVQNLPQPLAAQKIQQMEKQLSQATLLWAGGTTPKEARYFMIKSPGFIIELDNRSYEPNHIHSVWWELPTLSWNREPSPKK